MWCDCGNPRAFNKVVAVEESEWEAEATRRRFEKAGASKGYHYMRQELEVPSKRKTKKEMKTIVSNRGGAR